MYIAEVKKKEQNTEGYTEFDNMVLNEYLIKSKLGKTFPNEKVLKEYYVITYEINLFFYTNYKEKLKVDKNGHEYIHLEFMFIFLNII